MVLLDQGGRGRLALQLTAPPPNLRATVEHVWVQRYPFALSDAESWRIVADDAPYLLGQCTGRGVRLVLVGARTTYLDIRPSGRCFTVGARLRPGALLALFGIPANELTDRSVPLGDVLGRAPAEACDALAAVDAQAAVRSFLSFLRERTRVSAPIDARVTALLRVATDGVVTLRSATKELGLSERTARYWSQQHVGMGMKRLGRIRRLHRALRHGLYRPGIGWGRIAADAGYADQSHLIRDCRAFLGEPPTAFAARARG